MLSPSLTTGQSLSCRVAQAMQGQVHPQETGKAHSALGSQWVVCDVCLGRKSLGRFCQVFAESLR